MFLARATLVVGLATAASRTLGFVRDVLIAGLLGAGPVADAFLIAFRLPNLVRGALNEGGLNAGFVPLYAQRRARDGRVAAGRLANEAVGGMAALLLLLVGLVEAGAGLFVLALAAGYAGAPSTLDLATLYTRLAFPALAGVGLAALIAARLNAERRYAAAALAPVAASVAIVAALAGLSTQGDWPKEQAAAWLAGAVTVAALVHLGLVVAAARRLDPPLAVRRPKPTPEMRRLLGVTVAGLAAGGASQLILLAGMQVASFTPSAVSWLYYAERVFHLPVGLVGAAMGIVVLPAIADRHAAGDRAGFDQTQNRALETGLLFALPAACALALLARPIATVLFQRGAFTPEDTLGTAAVLAGLAPGLPFAVAAKVLAQGLFARGEIRLTLGVGALALAVTLLSCALLTETAGAVGLGLGVSLGFAAQTAGLAWSERRSFGLTPDRRLTGRSARIVLSTLVMAAGLAGLDLWLDATIGVSRSTALETLLLAARCIGGLALYAGAALAFGAVTRDDLAALRRT